MLKTLQYLDESCYRSYMVDITMTVMNYNGWDKSFKNKKRRFYFFVDRERKESDDHKETNPNNFTIVYSKVIV